MYQAPNIAAAARYVPALMRGLTAAPVFVGLAELLVMVEDWPVELAPVSFKVGVYGAGVVARHASVLQSRSTCRLPGPLTIQGAIPTVLLEARYARCRKCGASPFEAPM
ncbi:hypothetical protein MRB53_042174 [Persea americana]|nr:hypothetical protein MRB53_042174 [Persea americana]